MSEVLERKKVAQTNVVGKERKRPEYHVILFDEAMMDVNEHCHVSVLRDVFNMSVLEAFDHTSKVQSTGWSVVATYKQQDVAEMKASEARLELTTHQEHNPFVQTSGFKYERAA